jgi:uncharacterized membrane protein SpoIIM required for sporulation
MFSNILQILSIAYLLALGIGFVAGRLTHIKVSKLKPISDRLYDPYTVRLKRLWHGNFQDNINRARFLPVFITIFLNNLLLAAFISRVVYGLVFFYPALLTLWGGFAKGVVFARVPAFNPLLLLEFVAYLLAASLGIHLGLGVLLYFITGASDTLLDAARAFIAIFPIVAFILLVHSLVETRLIIKARQLAPDMEFDMQQAREEMLKQLDRKPE